MSSTKKFAEALKRNLSLRTPPIALKLLRTGEDLPEGVGRPIRDLGERIRPCTGWNLVRHSGVPMVMLEEDFSSDCPPGLFVFGLMEPIPAWIDGALAHDIYTADREAARIMESHVPRLRVGEYRGIAMAALETATFSPDLVIVYCDSDQARRLVTAAAWQTGEPLKMTMAARALCGDGVVQAVLSGRPVVAIPCGGDRAHGGTQDDELVFVTPVVQLEEIAAGLDAQERTHKVDRLGDDSLLHKRYMEMAGTVDRLRREAQGL